MSAPPPAAPDLGALFAEPGLADDDVADLVKDGVLQLGAESENN